MTTERSPLDNQGTDHVIPSHLAPRTSLRLALRPACVGAALALAVPAIAQQASDEITVTGRYGQLPDSVQSVSQAVSYADLDLSTSAGKAEVRHRLALTARFLCQELGEPDTASPPIPSCRDNAVKDAMSRVATMEEQFSPRRVGMGGWHPMGAALPDRLVGPISGTVPGGLHQFSRIT